jgi:iron-sulfur cluster repair protein YtfE (RIC family)
MIDEQFLQSAVNLRRSFLKINNNMDLYQRQAQLVVERLESTIEKINKISEDYKETSKSKNPDVQATLSSLLKVLQDIEDEGKKIEELVDPMNREIEKLAKEEQELYRIIKERHSDLSDEQIINSVRDRLVKENLS